MSALSAGQMPSTLRQGGHGRVLITGASGQVGLALQQEAPSGWEILACRSDRLDVTDGAAVRRAFHDPPDLVIHAAAFTAVDAAETAPDRAAAVNVRGTAYVAQAARDAGARMIYLSTDFVFDGAAGRPYTTDDAPNPLGVYGQTKLEGEGEAVRALGERALIVRTAWVYSPHRSNFVLTMLRLLRERATVGVVADQVGTPTWARSLAGALWKAAARPELHGILHFTDAGVASWYDFAVAVQEEALALGLVPAATVAPINTAQYPTAARRPAYSVLDKLPSWALLGETPPHWRVNLRRMLQELPRG